MKTLRSARVCRLSGPHGRLHGVFIRSVPLSSRTGGVGRRRGAACPAGVLPRGLLWLLVVYRGPLPCPEEGAGRVGLFPHLLTWRACPRAAHQCSGLGCALGGPIGADGGTAIRRQTGSNSGLQVTECCAPGDSGPGEGAGGRPASDRGA